MKKRLEEKLQQEKPTFQDSEIAWMLDNIGAEDPKVRDELIYSLMTRAIIEEALTEKQFQQIAQTLTDEELVFYEMDIALPAVLTRSFAALQSGNLLNADGYENGRYFHLLSNAEREQFFQKAIIYLQQERCAEGWSETYGWVHAFAHGADYLAAAISHPDFPSNLAEKALNSLESVFHSIGEVFTAGEERRLGEVVVSGILRGNLTQLQAAEWLRQVNFPQREILDYMRLASFEVFLAYIYFHLLEKLEDELKAELLNYLTEI